MDLTIITMGYKEQLMEIIDGVRDDFGVIGTFAFTGNGDLFDVNEKFWKVYEAARKAKVLVDEQLKEKGLPDRSNLDWAEIEGFKAILEHAGPPAMMANSGLFRRYTMQINQFFILAQQLE